ncbi:MAG TPA: hypothetical protein VE547_05580 [Mycobacteriales bacterium]|nr:hypothetical protein [Mycobacteriales bacterium]
MGSAALRPRLAEWDRARRGRPSAAPLFLAAAVLAAALPPLRRVRDVPLETR